MSKDEIVNILEQKMQKILNPEKIRENYESLKSGSKQLYELVVSEYFTVDKVVAESYATSFTPSSEIVFGGHSPSYNGGFVSKTIMNVTPKNDNIPVKTLNFDGFSSIKAGDFILAVIPKYESKKTRNALNKTASFYFDRELKSEESAIELILLSKDEKDKKVLRTERAVDYKMFMKE